MIYFTAYFDFIIKYFIDFINYYEMLKHLEILYCYLILSNKVSKINIFLIFNFCQSKNHTSHFIWTIANQLGVNYQYLIFI